MLEDCDHYILDSGETCGECGYIKNVTVECDAHCNALLNPATLDEYIDSLEHWRNHHWLSGCSHSH
jgi:hypothetical protein